MNSECVWRVSPASPSLPSSFSRKRRMNRRRRMVAVLRAWDTLELMSPEYVTRDFGGAFFPAPASPSHPPSHPTSLVPRSRVSADFYFSAIRGIKLPPASRVAFSMIRASRMRIGPNHPIGAKAHEAMIESLANNVAFEHADSSGDTRDRRTRGMSVPGSRLRLENGMHRPSKLRFTSGSS